MAPITQIPTSRPSITGEIISIDIYGFVTSEFSSIELENITETIKEQYGISNQEIELESTYQLSGLLKMSTPEDVSEKKALQMIEESLSELLGIHPSQMKLSLNEDGNMNYVISSETFDDLSAIQNEFENDEFVVELETILQNKFSEFFVFEIIPAEDGEIFLQIAITIDATNIEKNANVRDVINALIQDVGLHVSFEEYFLTSSPSNLPFTFVPSSLPSYSGSLIFMSFTTNVEEKLSQNEIDRLKNIVRDSYGIEQNEDFIRSTIEYKSTGVIKIEGAESLTPIELEIFENDLKNRLSNFVGIPSKNIDLKINPKSGFVTYTITSTTFDEIESVSNILKDDSQDFVEYFSNFTSEQSVAFQNILMTSLDTEETIIATVNFVMREEHVTKSVILGDNMINVLVAETYDFSSKMQFISSAPSIFPTEVTFIPTNQPSMSGIIATFELEQTTHSEMSTSELVLLEEEIAQNYGVNIDKVQLDLVYEISGSIKIDIPENVILNADQILLVKEIVQLELSKELDVHPSRIHVFINPETETVIYTILADEFADSDEIQILLNMKSEQIITSSNESFEELLNIDGVSIISPILVGENVKTKIDVSIDGSESSVILKEVDHSFIKDKGFDVSLEKISLVVPLPTKSPLIFPTSTIPTLAPSITGLTVLLNFKKVVTKNISANEFEVVEETILNTFDIDFSEDKIEMGVVYIAEGTFFISTDEESVEYVVDLLTHAIAETLGVHRSTISIEYDASTGEVIYVIGNEDLEILSDIIKMIDFEAFENKMNANLYESSIMSIKVGTLTLPTEVVVEIEVILDATGVEEVEQGMNIVISTLGSEYEVESELKFITSVPTVIPSHGPSVSPTTTIPSISPIDFGIVISVEAKLIVTENIQSNQMEQLTTEVADIYGVNRTNHVQTKVSYQISGTLDISFFKQYV